MADRGIIVVLCKYHKNFENRIRTTTKTAFGLKASCNGVAGNPKLRRVNPDALLRRLEEPPAS
jgi:hypothetical protein